MPELPEVETVRRVLEKSLVGLEINDIDIRYENLIDDEIDYFKDNIIGKKITSLSRYGKHLIFDLNEGHVLSHLRMEGKFFYSNDSSIDNKHVHVVFILSNGYRLYYQDVRKFGRFQYKKTEELYTTKPLKFIGVDPILEKSIDKKAIFDKIVMKRLPIKTTLLNQEIICGLGNIYVDEVLFLSNIRPDRPSNQITEAEASMIIDHSIEVLSKAIELKGTTIRSYTSSLGVEGGYQDYLCVHTKDVCPKCNSQILKIKIGGRGTYYCENCQE